jgi:hypothetical protein
MGGRALILISLVLGLLSTTLASARADMFMEGVQVGPSRVEHLVASGDDLYALGMTRSFYDPVEHRVWLAHSPDGGLNWEPAREVVSYQDRDVRLEVAAGGPRLVLALTSSTWVEGLGGGAGPWTLEVIASADRGQTFAAPMTVTDWDAFDPPSIEVAVRGSTAVVVHGSTEVYTGAMQAVDLASGAPGPKIDTGFISPRIVSADYFLISDSHSSAIATWKSSDGYAMTHVGDFPAGCGSVDAGGTGSEVVMARTLGDDLWLDRFTGAGWISKRVYKDVAGCDVAFRDGTVTLAYSEPSYADGRLFSLFTRSIDGGLSFSEPIERGTIGSLVLSAGRASGIDRFGNVRTWSEAEPPPDTLAPQTFIVDKPAELTDLVEAGFGFSASEYRSTFMCSLDAEPAQACPYELTVGPLTDGWHEMRVWAVDASGNVDPTPAVRRWRVDTTAPEVLIKPPPMAGWGPYIGRTVTFEIHVNDPDASVACTLDWAPVDCDTEVTLSGVSDGTHTFVVRATDEIGHVGTALVDFVVDTTPETYILLGPPALTAARDATFMASLQGEYSRFECSLDGAPFSVCEYYLTFEGLEDGDHVVAFRAVSTSGRIDPTPAEWHWTVDATAPELKLTRPSRGSMVMGQSEHPLPVDQTVVVGPVLLEAEATDPHGPVTLTFSVDGRTLCTGADTTCLWEPSPGSHLIEVEATDVLGNAAVVQREVLALAG